MTPRERQVLGLVRADPLISQAALARKLGISRSAVAGHIMRLTAKGLIRGRGYVVADTPFIAVAGGINVDICGAPAAVLRMRDSNPGTVTVSAGGVARNIAENLARLGADARLVGVVGEDDHGQWLIGQSRDAGVDTSRVSVVSAARTSSYVSILDDSGDMLAGVNDMDVIEALTPERLGPHRRFFEQAALTVVDTNLPEESLEWLAGLLPEGSLVVDTVSAAKAPRMRRLLGSVTLLKAGRAEAEALCGKPCGTVKQLEAASRWMHRRGVASLAITLGSQGAWWSGPDGDGLQPMPAGTAAPQNANGAGDAFAAGLVHAHFNGIDAAESIRLAMAAAAIAMQHEHTINPQMSMDALTRYREAVGA